MCFFDANFQLFYLGMKLQGVNAVSIMGLIASLSIATAITVAECSMYISDFSKIREIGCLSIEDTFVHAAIF